MATVETAQQPHDRPDRSGKRRPFSTWMKKLASFKGGSANADPTQPGTKRNTYQMKSHSKKQSASKNNNPYPESGTFNGSAAPVNDHRSFSTVPTGNESSSSLNRSGRSVRSSEDGFPPPTIGNKSMAATLSSEHDATHSDVAPSHATSSGDATACTVGVSSTRGQDSTFSSPAPSVRSLTTTLTTIHSAAAAATPAINTQNGGHGSSNGNNTQSIQFTHQFPISPPPSALPAHLVPQSSSGGHPATYNIATANNLLTDNASILTLASSSKRRRRRSMDTDASVRALAPSSLFGGSRESLPLSVLSSNIESNPTVGTPGLHQGRHQAERASIYSATGVTPALPSERNSYYAGKQSAAGDGGSVKSGMLGHGKNDSVSGSIGGIAASGSPLASPRELSAAPGRISRNNSGWGEVAESPCDDTETVEEKPEVAEENEKA